jgi:hypothetical protein
MRSPSPMHDRANLTPYVSNGMEAGPRIGAEKGPLDAGVLAQVGWGHARFLKRQLSLPVSTISQ